MKGFIEVQTNEVQVLVNISAISQIVPIKNLSDSNKCTIMFSAPASGVSGHQVMKSTNTYEEIKSLISRAQ